MANVAPSLANMTGTRTDSASKHIRVCRVGQDYICNWIGKTFEELKVNKTQFAVIKDHFFIACGRPLFDSNGAYNNMKPYAVGLAHLHDLAQPAKDFIAFMNHVCVTRKDMSKLIKWTSNFLKRIDRNQSPGIRAIAGIPDFYMGGVALTTGFPHGHIGDTALSVLTGGMMTIINGPFSIAAGDVCTWIWDFELCYFSDKGERLDLPANEADEWNKLVFGEDIVDVGGGQSSNIDQFTKNLVRANANRTALDGEEPSSKRRRAFNSQQDRDIFGDPKSHLNEGRKGSLPLLIPLPINPTYADRRRAFGRCMMSARPWDRTDIMLSRQGL